MLDKKLVEKINRLSDLLHEIKSPNFEKEYKCSYELAKEVFNKDLDELEEQIKKERGKV